MHILKKYKNNVKGILITNHKEFLYIKNKIKNIINKYYILVHYGFYVNNFKDNIIDLHLRTNEYCKNNKFIKYTSRNFLYDCFNNNYNLNDVNNKISNILKNNNIKYNIDNNNKNFDLLVVSRVNKSKLTHEAIQYIIKYIKNNKNAKCCIILLCYKNDDINYKNSILKECNNYSNNILLIDTLKINNNNNIFFGLTSEELSYFYKTSKVYLHTCEVEGESRTIHEALCCGCKILAKKNMKGGGLDYLDDYCSELYDKNTFLEKCMKIIKSYENYKLKNKLFEILNQSYTIPKFIKLLYEKLNYNEIYEKFYNSCNTDHLEFSMPGHLINVPWYIKGLPTADIKTEKQYDIFLKYI